MKRVIYNIFSILVLIRKNQIKNLVFLDKKSLHFQSWQQYILEIKQLHIDNNIRAALIEKTFSIN